MADKLTIGFADDHPILLRGIMQLFEDDPAYEVVGKAVCANSAMELVATHAPDVMVMDLSMPGDVFASIAHIAASAPNTRIVIFTAYSSIDAALRALDAGATGFVLKDSECEELFDAVSAVQSGEMYITKQYALQVMNGLREKGLQARTRDIHLTPREQQIMGMLANARTNREIAQQLDLSERTVKTYIRDLMVKVQARNRVEVALLARRILEGKNLSPSQSS